MPPVKRRVETVSRLSNALTTKTIDRYLSTLQLNTPNINILIFVVHFPSQYMNDRADVNIAVKSAAYRIKTEFKTSGADGYIVLGDFNLNPYDDALVAADGFNASMDRRIAMREQRTALGEEYQYTYNPCWSLLGDITNNPPGSYFWSSPGASSQHWHTLDQVLISTTLIPRFIDISLKRISTVGTTSLTNENNAGVQKIDSKQSDHLPLVFELAL